MVWSSTSPPIQSSRRTSGLFEPWIDAERTTEWVTVIRESYFGSPSTDHVTLLELTREHGFETSVVRRAFDELESAGIGEQLYVDDIGLALHAA